MASFLSLPTSTSSLLLLGEDTLGNSCASAASVGSCGTVKYTRLGCISTDSVSSRDSIRTRSLQRCPQNASAKLSACAEMPKTVDRAEITNHYDTFSGNLDHSAATLTMPTFCHQIEGFDWSGSQRHNAQPIPEYQRSENDGESNSWNLVDLTCESSVTHTNVDSQHSDVAKGHHAFRRWISRLRRRYQYPHTPPTTRVRVERWALDDFDEPQIRSSAQVHRSSHRESDSHTSSLGFVQAVKSATETLASVSIATMSRGNRRWLSEKRRSSVVSGSDPRASLDSQRSSVDDVARQRSYRRRQKLEELVSTEENYVADLKALFNAYSTILTHHPTRASFVRVAAKRTLADLLHLHDDILGHLHRVLPFAEYDKSVAKAPNTVSPRTHVRWHSVDIIPPRPTRAQAVLATIRQGRRSLNLSSSSDEDRSHLQSSPQTVTLVVRSFVEQMRRFKSYEEYGVNYDLVQQDIDETQQSISTWPEFDRAIEALSAHVSPDRSQKANDRRAMTVKDLLIKPVQRLPRYELLFNELRKLTPVCDDPEAHAKLTTLLSQLKETCSRMNEAKDNPDRARMLRVTFLIEDRLIFSSQIPRSVFSQLLGHVQLCGCLYVAYRGKERIKGSYMICVLFQSTLLLAYDEEEGNQQKYCTLAGISLATATIEETDNAKGLQCHTAPHAWKIVFEHSARMFELVFVACSSTEAEVWRKHISTGIQAQSQAVANGIANVFELQSPLTSEMRSVGKAFGKPGSFVRCMSVHRTATVGPTTDLNQVIIENTQAIKEVQDGSSQHSLPITRSQSTGTPSHVQTLAPRRAERHRLETLLADVWTRELLPYPRMVRRSDPLRASANNVIRKFSMASITSNFSSSKRSASHTSIRSWRKEEALPSRSRRLPTTNQICKGPEQPALPQLVNFHNAPEAFLPEDFELHDPSTTRANSTAGPLMQMTERLSDQPLEHGNDSSGLHRARSVRGGAKQVSGPAMSAEKKTTQRLQGPSQSSTRARNSTPTLHPSCNASGDQDGRRDKSPKKHKSVHRLFRLFATDH